GEYLLGGATSSSFPCSGQPYWMPVRKLRGPSLGRSRTREDPEVGAGRHQDIDVEGDVTHPWMFDGLAVAGPGGGSAVEPQSGESWFPSKHAFDE
ncbi:hypothetical protein ABZT12_39125, partial [Streptomyces sp. NPDC005423]